jgi:hypothetical protein
VGRIGRKICPSGIGIVVCVLLCLLGIGRQICPIGIVSCVTPRKNYPIGIGIVSCLIV